MFSQLISSLGEKITSAIGDRTDFGVNLDSPTRKQFQNFFEHYRIHDLLPYRSFDPQTQLFYNAESIGFVLECSPLVGCSEEMQREISGLFQHTLPEGSNTQFMLWADPRIDAWLQNWQFPRFQQGDLFHYLASKRVDFLRSLVFQAKSVTTLRDFRCLIAYSQKQAASPLETEKLLNVREQVITALRSLGSPVKIWDAQNLLNTLDSWINFNDHTAPAQRQWNRFDSLELQISSPQTSLQIHPDQLILKEGKYAIKAYALTREPDHWSLHAMGELIGDQFRDLMRVNCPFLIHYGVYIPPQQKTQTKVQSCEGWVEAQANSKIGKKIPIIRNQARELDFVRHQLSKGERFVQTNFSVLLFARHEEILHHEQTLLTLFRSKQWQLEAETNLHLPVFLSCLPMNWGEGFPDDLKFMHRLKTTLSTESANLLPLQGEWKGTSSPGIVLVGRRGQIFTWSPFDNNAGNYNVCVVGRSGAGKSVFMQELMTSTLGQGGQVFVLDVGRSFEKTVKLLGGEYIEFTPETHICINPFSSIPQDNAQETADALAMLKPVISLMAAPRDGTSDLENAHIERAIKHAWEQKLNHASITDIATFLSSQKDLVAKNLGQKLFPYTGNGTYGRFFNGPATVNLSSRMVVVELEELKERKDLQAVIVQMIILQITNRLYLGDRKTPSNLVLDEAWDMLRAKQSGEFIETAARRLRKYRGSLVVGTQSINDFYSTPGAQAAFDNSDWLCLLSQKKESIEQLKKAGRISMDPLMESMLTSVQTRQGDYAEVMIYGPHGYAIGRLLLDPFSMILYSTKAEEFAAVQDYVQQGMTLTEAIIQVAEERTPQHGT